MRRRIRQLTRKLRRICNLYLLVIGGQNQVGVLPFLLPSSALMLMLMTVMTVIGTARSITIALLLASRMRLELVPLLIVNAYEEILLWIDAAQLQLKQSCLFLGHEVSESFGDDFGGCSRHLHVTDRNVLL